jgi:GH24 family phage-related lysozyme (muramidase)
MIDDLRELLVRDEGMVLAVYLDHLGFSTAGCGHFLQERDPERGWPVGMAISLERADQWLEKDMKQCVSDAHWLQPEFDSFPIPAQITVASLAFQLGAPRYAKFVKHHAALQMQDWAEAAAQLRDSKLYRQTPERTERHAQRLESLA